MADEVILNKVTTIERCLERVREEYIGYEEELSHNYTRQDAIILNLLRACEAAIDLAMHVVRLRRLGLPQDSREAFSLLERHDLLEAEISAQMRAMVGFSNVAIHDYQNLSLEMVTSILEGNLDDFRKFSSAMLGQA
jgi:uncharacterized protein YutE (UPF0331/DUF86 family)